MVNLTKIIIPVFLLMAISVGVVYVNSNNNQKTANARPDSHVKVALAAPIESKIVSPDGKSNLVLKEKIGDEYTLWTVSVMDNQIFNESLPNSAALSVPFNTFSPDNKYIFLKQESSDSESFVVLSTDGNPILKDGSTLEITSLFYAKYPNYKITDVTGWASPTLIVVNVDKVDGGEGPSFWFDVSSKSFIQLSSRFN